MLCSVCDIFGGPENMASAEPSLSRKKKYPGPGGRDHLLYDKDEGESSDSLDVGIAPQEQDSRARIPDEETSAPSRSEGEGRKTEEKQPLMSQSYPPSTNPRGNPGTPGPPEEGGVPKTTEYRSQFVAWPRPPGESGGSTARKSASMGLIAPQFLKKEVPVDGEAPVGELWETMNDEDDEDAALDAVKRGRIKKTEYKAKFRPFSAYTYVDGSWKKATRLIKDSESATEADRHAWYLEVVERLKKADQYRTRSHTGAPLYGSENLPADLFFRDRTVLSPVSVAASSSRDSLDQSKSREGSRKKPQVEKTTVRPKSAEPVIPVAKSEHKSPKRTRPRAPRDLPVHGHGDLSGRKKAYKQSAEKGSPVGAKPRAVPRPQAAAGEEGGKVWLKPDSSKDKGADEEAKGALVNGFASEESDDHSVQPKMPEDAQVNGEYAPVPVTKPPMKVPLTTVKSPEEVTGVRSPDPESWTVPLEIGKGLHWMDGKTPDGVQAKGPPILLSKRLKESSLVGKTQKDIVLCDPGSENTGESIDL